MGAVAACGAPRCGGTLTVLYERDDAGGIKFEKKKIGGETVREPVLKGYVCERCSTIFEDVHNSDGKITGVRPSGKLETGDVVDQRVAVLQGQVSELEARQAMIREMVMVDETKLGAAVREVLDADIFGDAEVAS